MYNVKGDNPTPLYYQTMNDLYKDGDEVRPRGKLVKELRPSAIEFENPYNRVTFLGGRRINPFFQVAESLWILSGRADVEFLDKFNSNMKSFSDDGIWFNAPYGERIRHWERNSARNIMDEGLDQLEDVYKRFLHDKDTRQATIAIGNPSFDNYEYLVENNGRDIACNLYITFKIRDDKLHMTVFNRSNDLHWGVFGANLCQFTTIQETLLNWLKHSGREEFKDLEMGTYTQITDSLHIYMDSYGAKCTEDVINYYKDDNAISSEVDFSFGNEPKMALSIDEHKDFLNWFWTAMAPSLMDDSTFEIDEKINISLDLIEEAWEDLVLDSYWYFGIKSMYVYRMIKNGKIEKALETMLDMAPCQWLASMLYFSKSFIKKQEGSDNYENILTLYKENVNRLADNLLNADYADDLRKYLEID